MSVKILVVEDEGLVRKDIVNLLGKLGHTVVAQADNGEKAIELARQFRPDVALLDINLKGDMKGIQVAETIKREMDVVVIYLTAFADDSTLEGAKKTEPHGYVLKPFKEVDVKTAIDLALDKHSKEKATQAELEMLRSLTSYKSSAEFLFIKHSGKLVQLQPDDVYYVEALKDYVQVYTKAQRYTIHATMKDIERKLPRQIFQRVHRSYIVNMNKIASLQGTDLTVADFNLVIPIGNLYKDAFSERVNVL